MTRRAKVLPVLAAAAMLVACLAALLAASHEAEAAFPGGNGRIAFSADENTDETNAQIFTVEPDGTDTKQLTDTSVRHYNVEPSYSSDGTKIAWNRSGDIWIMNANGTGKQRLTSGPASDSRPAFSPDGRTVAFSRYDPQEGRRDIYLKALDGTGKRRVTKDQNYEGGPVFSPNGNRIAFSRAEAIPGCSGCADWSEIATVRPDGTGLRVLTDLPDQVDASAPDWSPDGRRLVFDVFDYGAFPERARIDTIRADGTGQKTVFAPKGFFLSAPVFSPDGTKIAFRYEDGHDIWTINPDGSGLTNLTNTPEIRERTPDWRPKPPNTT
jgi:TolB protein